MIYLKKKNETLHETYLLRHRFKKEKKKFETY